MKVAVPIPKNILAPLRITAAASTIDGAIQKKIHSSGATLIISNKEMNEIMKIVTALQDSNILLKGVAKTIKNETKKQKKGGFLSMLLGTLGASLLGNLFSPKLNCKSWRRSCKIWLWFFN